MFLDADLYRWHRGTRYSLCRSLGFTISTLFLQATRGAEVLGVAPVAQSSLLRAFSPARVCHSEPASARLTRGGCRGLYLDGNRDPFGISAPYGGKVRCLCRSEMFRTRLDC